MGPRHRVARYRAAALAAIWALIATLPELADRRALRRARVRRAYGICRRARWFPIGPDTRCRPLAGDPPGLPPRHELDAPAVATDHSDCHGRGNPAAALDGSGPSSRERDQERPAAGARPRGRGGCRPEGVSPLWLRRAPLGGSRPCWVRADLQHPACETMVLVSGTRFQDHSLLASPGPRGQGQAAGSTDGRHHRPS